MSKLENKGLPKEIKEKLEKLTPKEAKYFKHMWPKSGVLYITSKPGIAKSAIARSIADKMGFNYFDIRLSMVDETDVGLFPSLSEINSDGNNIKCLEHVVPIWAIEANQKPTIINFEELNRASQQVRNAALQILLERCIGTKFKFNDNVLMVATGNLGFEDGTDVEEFDTALNGRLIHVNHTLNVQEWIDGYAKDNVHPVIVDFLNVHREYFYKEPLNEENASKAYASPRSWTFLSDYIVSIYGGKSSVADFKNDVYHTATSYVGISAKPFIDFCERLMNLNIKDIINRFDEVRGELESYNRDKISELLVALKKEDIEQFSDIQIKNITKFCTYLSEDELTSYLLYYLDDPKRLETNPKTKLFLKQFKDILIKISESNRNLNQNKIHEVEGGKKRAN